MRMLLDTHTFLWFVLDDPRLSEGAKTAIVDEAAEVLVSPASYWEIAIKISMRKYSLKVPYETFWRTGIEDNDFRVLPIEFRHTAALVDLPFHHKDPFDRLLIAQAMVEGIPLVGQDQEFDRYSIRKIW